MAVQPQGAMTMINSSLKSMLLALLISYSLYAVAQEDAPTFDHRQMLEGISSSIDIFIDVSGTISGDENLYARRISEFLNDRNLGFQTTQTVKVIPFSNSVSEQHAIYITEGLPISSISKQIKETFTKPSIMRSDTNFINLFKYIEDNVIYDNSKPNDHISIVLIISDFENDPRGDKHRWMSREDPEVNQLRIIQDQDIQLLNEIDSLIARELSFKLNNTNSNLSLIIPIKTPHKRNSSSRQKSDYITNQTQQLIQKIYSMNNAPDHSETTESIADAYWYLISRYRTEPPFYEVQDLHILAYSHSPKYKNDFGNGYTYSIELKNPNPFPIFITNKANEDSYPLFLTEQNESIIKINKTEAKTLLLNPKALTNNSTRIEYIRNKGEYPKKFIELKNYDISKHAAPTVLGRLLPPGISNITNELYVNLDNLPIDDYDFKNILSLAIPENQTTITANIDSFEQLPNKRYFKLGSWTNDTRFKIKYRKQESYIIEYKIKKTNSEFKKVFYHIEEPPLFIDPTKEIYILFLIYTAIGLLLNRQWFPKLISTESIISFIVEGTIPPVFLLLYYFIPSSMVNLNILLLFLFIISCTLILLKRMFSNIHSIYHAYLIRTALKDGHDVIKTVNRVEFKIIKYSWTALILLSLLLCFYMYWNFP